MRSRSVKWLVVWAVVGGDGCGDDAVPGCDPDVPCGAPGSSTGSGEGSTSAASVDTDGEVDDGDASAGQSDTTGGGGTSTGTTDPGGTSTTGDTTQGDAGSGSTGAAGDVLYRAEALPGGLDRIRVFKEDLDADRCTWMVLVMPGGVSPYAVMAPAGWAVESISASDAGAACNSDSPAMFGSEPAVAATGTVTFGLAGAVYPCEIDVDVTADFAGVLPGIPPQDTLQSTSLPVSGC
jgi:hypothetical protein